MNQLIGIADWYVMRQVSMPITRNRVVAPRTAGRPMKIAVAGAIPDARETVSREIAPPIGQR